MKNFSLYTEELDFNNKEGKNITVGKYETEYFTLCPGAVDAFTNLMKESGVDMAKVEEAAKHVDQALDHNIGSLSWFMIHSLLSGVAGTVNDDLGLVVEYCQVAGPKV